LAEAEAAAAALKKRQDERLHELKLQTDRDEKLTRDREKYADVVNSEVQNWLRASNKDLAALLSSLDRVFPCQAGAFAVAAGAPFTAVKKSYFRALLVVHPDKNASGSPDLQQRSVAVFQALSTAFEKQLRKHLRKLGETSA